MLNSISELYNPLLEKASPTLTLDWLIVDHKLLFSDFSLSPFSPKNLFYVKKIIWLLVFYFYILNQLS